MCMTRIGQVDRTSGSVKHVDPATGSTSMTGKERNTHGSEGRPVILCRTAVWCVYDLGG